MNHEHHDIVASGENMKKVFVHSFLGFANKHLLLPFWSLIGNDVSLEFLLQATDVDVVVGR